MSKDIFVPDIGGDEVAVTDRITSYNVCYTKLLRIPVHLLTGISIVDYWDRGIVILWVKSDAIRTV